MAHILSGLHLRLTRLRLRWVSLAAWLFRELISFDERSSIALVILRKQKENELNASLKSGQIGSWSCATGSIELGTQPTVEMRFHVFLQNDTEAVVLFHTTL